MTSRLAHVPHAVPQPVEHHGGAERISVLEAELDGLRQAMVERATIEQAKGMLMMRYGLSEDAAFSVLVRWSNDSNVKLRAVARSLVDLGGTLGVSPGDDIELVDLHRAVLERCH
jgi:hypothetical protein